MNTQLSTSDVNTLWNISCQGAGLHFRQTATSFVQRRSACPAALANATHATGQPYRLSAVLHLGKKSSIQQVANSNVLPVDVIATDDHLATHAVCYGNGRLELLLLKPLSNTVLAA